MSKKKSSVFQENNILPILGNHTGMHESHLSHPHRPVRTHTHTSKFKDKSFYRLNTGSHWKDLTCNLFGLQAK